MLFRLIEVLAGLLAWTIAASVLGLLFVNHFHFVARIPKKGWRRYVRSVEEEAL